MIFAYNRPTHLKNLFESIQSSQPPNQLPTLIFIDGPKSPSIARDVQSVISCVNDYKSDLGINKITIRKTNLGLAKSVITGVSETLLSYDQVIVLEDDIEISPFFLKYMDKSLDVFRNDRKIGSITGYKFANTPFRTSRKMLMTSRHSSWAWGTWSNRWAEIDWDILSHGNSSLKILKSKISGAGEDLPRMIDLQIQGKIDSWSIIFDSNAAMLGWKCIHPYISLARNCGMDGSGTHYISQKTERRVDSKWHSIKLYDPLRFRVSRIYDIKVWWNNSRYYQFYIKPFLFIRSNYKKLTKNSTG